jgi:hypothetical protein
MAKDKSIIEKFRETMKGLADSASEALKAEEPPKADAAAAAYLPFAASGLVSDPVLVPPIAAQPARRKTRVAKRARRSAKPAKTSARKTSARKAAKKATRASAKKRTAAKKALRKRGRR